MVLPDSIYRLRLKRNLDKLLGLLSAIVQFSVYDVRHCQVGNIHKVYSSAIICECEEIYGESHVLVGGLEVQDSLNVFFRQGSLGCFLRELCYLVLLEGIEIWRNHILIYCHIVNGAKCTESYADCVFSQTFSSQMALISSEPSYINLREGNVKMMVEFYQ